MIKVCFYSNLYPQTAEQIAGYDFELVETSASDTAYWEAIGSYWGKDDLVIIEQDMQFLPECLDSFEKCPEPWCLYDYEIIHIDTSARMCKTGIGFCRIRKELQQAIPFESEFPIHWGWTDKWLNHLIDANGFGRHAHGLVDHYHNYENPFPDVPDWRMEIERSSTSEDKTFTDNVSHLHPPPWDNCNCGGKEMPELVDGSMGACSEAQKRRLQ